MMRIIPIFISSGLMVTGFVLIFDNYSKGVGNITLGMVIMFGISIEEKLDKLINKK